MRSPSLRFVSVWVNNLFCTISDPNDEVIMSSNESGQVLALLKELSLLEELDTRYEAGLKTESEREDHRLRQQGTSGNS